MDNTKVPPACAEDVRSEKRFFLAYDRIGDHLGKDAHNEPHVNF